MGVIKIELLIIMSIILTVTANSDLVEARKKIFHAFYFHAIFGVVAVIVVIKIILVMAFFGMLGGFFHMFAGMKYLLKSGFFKHEYEHPHFPPSEVYSSHEHISYDSPGPAVYDGPYKRQDFQKFYKQDLDGGRHYYDKSAGRQFRKRSASKSGKNKRTLRSADFNDNCKRRIICELHARANINPFYAYQLYFIRRDGLAKYWDHKYRKFHECSKIYPCNRNWKPIS